MISALVRRAGNALIRLGIQPNVEPFLSPCCRAQCTEGFVLFSREGETGSVLERRSVRE
jgi:hypothetical protein